jgi:hypothetical protein
VIGSHRTPMKFSSLLLASSLAINVALLATLLLTPADPAPLSTASSSAAGSASPARVALNATPITRAKDKPWARLGTENIVSLVERLRAAGYPPSVLRAIVELRFELRREELTLDGLDHPYWKSDAAYPADPKLAAELAQLDRESADTFKQLFGPNDPAGSDEDNLRFMRLRQYGNLSGEKISQLQAIQQSFGERLSQIYNSASGRTLGPDAAEKIDLVNREQHAAIAKLLTPDELLEYDLRASNTASQLRGSLTGFNPTEAEYRALFPLYQSIDDRFGSVFKPEVSAARAAAQQQMQEQIKAVLPPDRYADYLQASRPEYQQLNQLVTRLELPLSAAAQVVAVQSDIMQRANPLLFGTQLAPADRAAQLAALSDEAAAKIAAVIGTRGLAGYKQYGGQWLTQLQPRPVRANAKN